MMKFSVTVQIESPYQLDIKQIHSVIDVHLKDLFKADINPNKATRPEIKKVDMLISL
jgi:hypothetical protein